MKIDPVSLTIGLMVGSTIGVAVAQAEIVRLRKRFDSFVARIDGLVRDVMRRQAETGRLVARMERDRDLDDGLRRAVEEGLGRDLEPARRALVQPWFDNLGPLGGAAR